MFAGSPIGSTPEASQAGTNGAYVYALLGASPTYTVSGNADALTYGTIMYVQSGMVFANAGSLAGSYNRAVQGAVEAYALGASAQLHVVYGIRGQPEAVSLAGEVVSLAPLYGDDVTPGTYMISFGIAGQAYRQIAGYAAAYRINGTDAVLQAQRQIVGQHPTYAVGAASTTYEAGYSAIVRGLAIITAGLGGTLRTSRKLNGTTAAYEVGAVILTGQPKRTLSTRIGRFYIDGSGAIVRRSRIMRGAPAQISVSGMSSQVDVRRALQGVIVQTHIDFIPATMAVSRRLDGLRPQYVVTDRSIKATVVRGVGQAGGDIHVEGAAAQPIVDRRMDVASILVELLVPSAQLAYSGDDLIRDTDAAYLVQDDMIPSTQSTGGNTNDTNVSAG